MKGTVTVDLECFENLLKLKNCVDALFETSWWCCNEDDIDGGFLAFEERDVLKKHLPKMFEMVADEKREQKWDKYRTKKEYENEIDK